VWQFCTSWCATFTLIQPLIARLLHSPRLVVVSRTPHTENFNKGAALFVCLATPRGEDNHALAIYSPSASEIQLCRVKSKNLFRVFFSFSVIPSSPIPICFLIWRVKRLTCLESAVHNPATREYNKALWSSYDLIVCPGPYKKEVLILILKKMF
jgi:hypothetical protein